MLDSLLFKSFKSHEKNNIGQLTDSWPVNLGGCRLLVVVLSFPLTNFCIAALDDA